MDLAMAEDAICQAFSDAWADLTPVEWPNVATEGPALRDGNAAWCSLAIRHDGSDQRTLGEEGGRVFTRTGGLTVQIFVPAGQRGLQPASSLATVAQNAFEGKTVGGVRFYRVGAHTVGSDGVWYQVNVRADFEFDETK